MGFRCAYVATYTRIKTRSDLRVTPQQWAAIGLCEGRGYAEAAFDAGGCIEFPIRR